MDQEKRNQEIRDIRDSLIEMKTTQNHLVQQLNDHSSKDDVRFQDIAHDIKEVRKEQKEFSEKVINQLSELKGSLNILALKMSAIITVVYIVAKAFFGI